jgi:hypothetical protein
MRDDESDHDEHANYFRFTGPRRLETAMHTLHGLVEGIRADSDVCAEEVKRLILWMRAHEEFADIHPFDEVIKAIHRIVADGVVDSEEREDLLWLVTQFEPGSNLYDAVTADIQRLHGFLTGILADGRINDHELSSLQTWVDDHPHLRACWPYDELESIIVQVMKDGIVDDNEQKQLRDFFGEFDQSGTRSAVGAIDSSYSVSGVCATCPEIAFPENEFCFTGSSERVPRKELAAIVTDLGGSFKNALTNGTAYLIVGADGNPCWAYACYGRKVEDAVRRRRNGQRLLIVHEYDFWDAVEDAK